MTPLSSSSDTIAAIATAPGRGAVGILRLSGPQARVIAGQLCGPLPESRRAALRTFRDTGGTGLDQGLLLCFDAPHTFTGEDVVEFQGHGGPVVLQSLLQAACACGARVARPGEFSERAFCNGRLDLAQAEAIADLIDAGSQDAARAALRSLDGELSRRVGRLADELTSLRVFVEGALDFSDEDVDWLADAGLHRRITTLQDELRRLLADARRGRRLRDGMTIALTGRPNVGKSTLLNRLAGSDVAIVTDVPGTTRDVLREHLDLDGLPVSVVDTAGLRDSDDPVEREGVRRARNALEQAELALFVTDAEDGPDTCDHELLQALPPQLTTLVLHNKCDRGARPPGVWREGERIHLRLSAATGAGLDLLVRQIRDLAGLGETHESLFSARARHLDVLQRTLALVDAAAAQLSAAAPAELAAEDLRQAQATLGEITGQVSSDDLLGVIFSRFCIGK